MGETKIQWTDRTFNPVLGCAKAHGGCTNCYAEVHQAVAMRQGGRVRWGEVWQGGDRVVVADSTWKKPLAWAKEAARKGERLRVFCASLSDVLEVPQCPASWPRSWTSAQISEACERVALVGATMEAARQRLWHIIRETACIMNVAGLDWQVLTKRPENWRLVPEDVRPLVWLGTSVSDQETADEWVPRLLEAEGFRYRFLSLEPMIGPVDLDLGRCEWHGREHVAGGHPDFGDHCTECAADGWSGELSHGHWLGDAEQGVDWVIVGGESGNRARALNTGWVGSVVRQCQEAGVPVFVKQLGSVWAKATGATMPDEETGQMVADTHGGWGANWPEQLRVRQWPGGAP